MPPGRVDLGFGQPDTGCGDGVEREEVVGAQFVQPQRVGREFGGQQRVERCGERGVGQRIGPHAQRIRSGCQPAAHDGARAASELRTGGRPEGREGQQQEHFEPDPGHGVRSGTRNVR